MVVRERGRGSTAQASVTDTARVALAVLGRTLAGGVIARRPTVFGVADRLNADLRALRTLQQLADRYGPGPVRLTVPGRPFAVVVSPLQVPHVLGHTPEPFAAANLEKRGALAHFQPHGVLISHGRRRARRREFNEAVLDSDHPLHQMAEPIVGKLREEAAQLAATALAQGGLISDEFIAA